MAYALQGGARPANPLCLHFNVAVMAIAARLFPVGFDVGEDAPDTLEGLTDLIERTGRMKVWVGASDTSIFDSPEVNYAFRAWHDWIHWKFQFPFTIEGEAQCVAVHIDHLRTVYGASHPLLPKWSAMIEAEVVGQNEYHARTGAFPCDQRAFVANYLAERGCDRGYALAA